MNAINSRGYQDVPMTRRRAQLLAEYADKLAEMLENAPDDQDLAEWVQSKIDRAAGAIQSAYHYLDQEDDDELEKARTKKYDYRRPSKRVNKRTGRREWDYFYAKKHGAKVSEGAFVEGAAFRLTWKGRKGHFHIHHVSGDQVFISHDSRPDMEPVAISKSELRALLKKQHGKAEQEHLDKKRRDVERIKSKGVKRGLGLALHRLRQAAQVAGVQLDERYQRKPKKKKTTETAREDRFDTMPEVESAEDLRAEFKRKIEANEGDYRLYVELFNVANYSETLANVPDSELFEHPITQELLSLTVAYPNDPVYIYLALQELPKEYTKRLFTELLRRYKETGERPISEGASVGIMQAHQHHFEQSTAPTAPPPIEEKDHPLLGLKTLDLDPQQVRSSYRNISHTPGKRAESERREWSETLDQLETQAESEIQAGASREEVEKRYQKLAQRLLRAKQSVISARAQTASSAITGAGQFNARQAQKRQQTLERREAEYRQALQKIKDTQPPTQTTPRDQLTETAQQIIEEANQEHEERHEEHQEITRFELGEHTHTKTGAKLYTAKQKERTDRDEYFRRVEIAKKHGGRYERRYVHGFVFKTAEDARAFALEVEGDQVEEISPDPDVREQAKSTFHRLSDLVQNLKSWAVIRTQTDGAVYHSASSAVTILKRGGKYFVEVGPTDDRLRLTTGTIAHFLRTPDGKRGFDTARQAAKAAISFMRENDAETVTPHDEHPGADNFETMPEVETPEKGEPVQDERFEYGLELEALAKRAGLKYSEQGVARSVDARLVRNNEPHVMISPPHLQKVYPKLTQEQVNDFKARAIAYLKEFTGDDLTEDIQQTAQSNQTRSRMIYKELDAAIGHIINEVGNGGRDERKATLQAVKMLAEWRESIQQPTTPREQLTETAREVTQGADNFETMPEVESAEDRTRGDLKSKQQALDLLRRSEQEDELKGKLRAKSAGAADKALMRAVREILKRPDPTQDLDERDRQRLQDSLFSLEEAQRPTKYMNAQRSKEARQRARDTIKEILAQQVRMISEALNPTPTPQTPAPEPTTPSTRPASAYYGRATKKLVDQALSSEPTDFNPKRSGIDLPTKGDLREMLSQEQRLKRAKEDLRQVGVKYRPSFPADPRSDIMYALSGYLNGPYVELEQERIREMERGLKIALRDSRGEELEQVKDETARFWREWGGEYKRLQRELVTERTQGEALRNIRPLIPDHVLTPEINQLLDQMERELDQRPVTGNDIAQWIDTRDTNQATRDRQPKTQPTTPREQLTETAREVTQGADNFETMPEVEARDLKAYKRVRRLTRKAEKLDRATGRRTNESKKADQSLAQAARSLLETEFADLPSAQEISRKRQTSLTPEEARKAAITGALNKLERNQTASGAGSAAQAYENRSEARAILEREMRDRLETAAPLPTPRDRGPQIEEPPRATIYDDVPLAKPRPEPRAQTVDKYTAAIYSERLDTKPALKYRDALSAIERYQDGVTSTAVDRELLEETAGDLSPFIHRLLAEHRPASLGIKGDDARYQRYKDYADYAGFTIPSQMELKAPGRSESEIIKKISLHLLSRVILTERSTRGDLAKELARGFAQYDEATRDRQPTAPARQALTETVRELSDQPARTAAVRSTPRASEATLTGSGELSRADRANLIDRARFITSGSEEATKTGRRSRGQKAKDQELLLIYNRLHSDASARLGPLAPRFADYSQFVKLQGGDLPERAQTRADFRAGIMSSIEELRNATTAQPTSSTQKSANHLIDYRAQLLQTIERIA